VVIALQSIQIILVLAYLFSLVGQDSEAVDKKVRRQWAETIDFAAIEDELRKRADSEKSQRFSLLSTSSVYDLEFRMAYSDIREVMHADEKTLLE